MNTLLFVFLPYVVYRSRDAAAGARPPRRGWEPVRLPTKRGS